MSITNNMNKETKTILFASLVAVIILSCPGMNYVVVEQTGESNKK